ncbi:hypothetical protein [Sphingomonas aerophila]|uniref:Uncharacterized protein n=1 Tax=Sphingomonas aerophila TaxID=1344948 RepID=A0A7W9EWS4_9SPHN|nr:hypothetical protein [Sphingomonas aerophila]MBB5715838.1 hypothetical protein [Sphingomonas aerophila]
MKRSVLSRIGSVVKAAKPHINWTTLAIALALASTFGLVAPDTATKLRDVVALLPSSTGDLVRVAGVTSDPVK